MAKRTLLTLVITLLLILSSVAQGPGSTCTIEYTDGQRVEWKDDGKTPPGDILMSFLNSPKDGKMTVIDGGKTSFVLDKVGKDLTITAPGGAPEKMTVQELIEGLQDNSESSDESESAPAPAPAP